METLGGRTKSHNKNVYIFYKYFPTVLSSTALKPYLNRRILKLNADSETPRAQRVKYFPEKFYILVTLVKTGVRLV